MLRPSELSFDPAADPDLNTLVDGILSEENRMSNDNIEMPGHFLLKMQVEDMLQTCFGVSELPTIDELELGNCEEEKQARPSSRYIVAFPLRTERLRAIVEFYKGELFQLGAMTNKESLKSIAEITHSLGRICFYLGDYNLGLNYFLIELKIRTLFLIKTKIKDKHIVSACFYLGETYFQLKNYEEAIKLYSSALIIMRDHFDAADKLIGDILYALGEIHLSKGKEILVATEEAIIDKNMSGAGNNIKNATCIFNIAGDYLSKVGKFYSDNKFYDNNQELKALILQLQAARSKLVALKKTYLQKKEQQVSEEKCRVAASAHCQSVDDAVFRQAPPFAPLSRPNSYAPQGTMAPFSACHSPVPSQAAFPQSVPQPNGHSTQRATISSSAFQAPVPVQPMASRPSQSFQTLPVVQDALALPFFQPSSNPLDSVCPFNQHQKKAMPTTSKPPQVASPTFLFWPNNNARGATTASASQRAVSLPMQPMVRRPNQFFSVPASVPAPHTVPVLRSPVSAQQAAPLPAGYVKNAMTQPFFQPRVIVPNATRRLPPVPQNKFGQ